MYAKPHNICLQPVQIYLFDCSYFIGYWQSIIGIELVKKKHEIYRYAYHQDLQIPVNNFRRTKYSTVKAVFGQFGRVASAPQAKRPVWTREVVDRYQS